MPQANRSFLLILGLMALLYAGMWPLERWSSIRYEENLDRHRRAEFDAAFALANADLADIQGRMATIARRLSNRTEVVSGLAAARDSGPTRNAEFVRVASELSLPPQTSVEFHTPAPRPVNWSGFGMPLDTAPQDPDFLDRPQTAVAVDGERRAAFSLWWPVRNGDDVVGVVRVLRMVRSLPPVQNRYLRDYRLEQDWTRRSGLRFRLRLDSEPTVLTSELSELAIPEDGRLQRVIAATGETLGTLLVELPPSGVLVDRHRQRFADARAFWAGLALMWILVGAWRLTGRRPVGPWAEWPVGLRFIAFAGLTVGVRYALAAFDLPGRFQAGKAPLAPLFDPAHLASGYAGGLLRSTGDLALTAVFALLLGAGALRCALATVRDRPSVPTAPGRPRSSTVLRGAISVVGVYLVVWFLARLTRRAILDSTLDYFERSGLLPEDLVLVVFGSLLGLTLASVLVCIALLWVGFPGAGLPLRRVRLDDVVTSTAVAAAVVIFVHVVRGQAEVMSFPVLLGVMGGIGVLAMVSARWAQRWLSALSLRNVLLCLFVLTALLYPLIYRGVEADQKQRLVDAVVEFDDGRDPAVIYAIERLLTEAAQALPGSIYEPSSPDERRLKLDSAATAVLRSSLLAGMGSYDVSLVFYDDAGDPVGRYYESDDQQTVESLDRIERSDLAFLREMYSEWGQPGPLVEPTTGKRETKRIEYQGLLPVSDGESIRAWVVARAATRVISEAQGTPFPRVLVPASLDADAAAEIALAEFRKGVLVRSSGGGFGRYRLPDDVDEELSARPTLWRSEEIRGKKYTTYYARLDDRREDGSIDRSIVASRIAAMNVFDHLYYVLRLTVAGLFLGVPFYLALLVHRRRLRTWRERRVSFRDKILNAFFAVGIVTVAAMGIVGLEVVTGENERAIESWLRQHLERVERTLALEAGPDELPYSVLDRIRVDSLAARVGLDLNVYRGTELTASSRPQLERDGLIDRRLPVQVYDALFFQGFRFVGLQQQVGTFRYTAGYRALPDEEGRPHYVIAVPTLPEQERIEEERARTVAYLFGALLLLVLAVLITASVFANALTRPILRIREGLESVARGRFQRIPPLDTRDEFGELVDTFNTMQGQLSDSRRRLAQQERQLAWREMARQVAHEIKNPLTPMKLSVQHLRRAFEQDKPVAAEESGFKGVFDRITSTLVDQIDALARIANEFSSFARMPSQVVETLDLNSVVQEAVDLMEAEGAAEIATRLGDHPLLVSADHEELRRTFINLLKNAIQSLPAGRDGQVTVSTGIEPEPDTGLPSAYASVADNGTGVPEELKGRIFEPNFSTKTSGTGLGLAISRKSVEDFGGTMGFETRSGEGSTFWVRLPIVDGA